MKRCRKKTDQAQNSPQLYMKPVAGQFWRLVPTHLDRGSCVCRPLPPNISRHSPSFTSLFLAKAPTATVTLNIEHNVRDKTTQYYYIHTTYILNISKQKRKVRIKGNA